MAIVFCQTRRLTQEYTYRYLAAAYTRVADSSDTATVFGADATLAVAPDQPEPNTIEIQAWPVASACPSPTAAVRPAIRQAWHDAHRSSAQ